MSVVAEKVKQIDREYVNHTDMIGEGMSGGSGFAQDTFMDTGYNGYGKSGGVKRYRKHALAGSGFISDLGIPVISGLAGMFGLGKSGGGKSGGSCCGDPMCRGCDRKMGCGKSGAGKSGGRKKGRGIVSTIKSLLGFKKSPAQGLAQHVVSRVAERVPALARARDVVGMVRSAREQFRPAVREARDRVYREVEDRVVPAVHRARANARNVLEEGERKVRSQVRKAVEEGRTRVRNVGERARKEVKKVVRQTRRMVEPEFEEEDYADEYGSGRSGAGGSGAGKSGGRRLVPKANMQSSSMAGGGKRIHPLKETPALRRIMDTFGLTLQEAHKHRLAAKAHKRYKHGTQKDGRQARAKIVKKVMMEKGLSLPEASKYVKANGLY